MEKESNKMTAVDWFIEQLEQKGDAWENVSIRRIQISVDVSEYLDLKRQAKEMEKEQHEKTWNDSFEFFVLDVGIEFQNYYEQTYGGNK